MFFYDMSLTHTIEELQKLLVAGLDFLDSGMVKIEVDHLVPGLIVCLLGWKSGAQQLGCLPISHAIY